MLIQIFFVEKVEPKLVITFIDNTFLFHTSSQRHSSIKTMFIQNETQGNYTDAFESLNAASIKAYSSMEVYYMLSFGRNVGLEFSRYIKHNMISIGPLKNTHLSTI